MPSFISKGGIWEPAQEKAYDPKSGEIYVGPDRAAVQVEKDNGGPLGQDALQDPQLLQASRNAGFNSVAEYMAYNKPTPKQEADIKVAQEKVNDHKEQEPKPAVETGTPGGFFDPAQNETPDSVMVEKIQARRPGRPKKVT